MSNLLFLYATKNSGHKKAADAIQKSLTLIAPDTKSRGIDFFTHHYPNLGPFIFRMYIDLMHSVPHVWDYIYDHPDVTPIANELRRFLNVLNVPKLRTLLRAARPDAIICTQALPAAFIAREKQKEKLDIPLYVTITDFIANPYWPHAHVDTYFVPHEEVRDQLNVRGIPESRIKVTGIPIDDAFAHKQPAAILRAQLGLKRTVPTILIMGGSHGLGQIEAIVKELQHFPAPIQAIIVTGHNRSLHRRLTERYRTNRSLRILGFTRAIADLMDTADILISKPGGLTSSEALAKGLPMIIVAPLPGQEERNADFLVRNGVALRCSATAEIVPLLHRLVTHPLLLKKMRAQALVMGKPYASLDVASHIIGSI